MFRNLNLASIFSLLSILLLVVKSDNCILLNIQVRLKVEKIYQLALLCDFSHSKGGNIEKEANVGNRYNGNPRAMSKEQPLLEIMRKSKLRFPRLKTKSMKNSPWNSSGEYGCSVKTRHFRLEPAWTDTFGNRIRNIPNKDVQNQESNRYRSRHDRQSGMGSSLYQSNHSIDSDTGEAPHSWYLASPTISIKFSKEVNSFFE